MLIIKTLQQVEGELKEFIERFLLEDKLPVEDVKKWVYEESGTPLEATHKFQTKFFKYFGETGADINEVLQIGTDAWNYFPHEILGGKSPHQIVEENQKKYGREK